MKIRKRRINSQDHTLGYLVGNNWRTRKQAIVLAREGRISGVTIAGSGMTQHLRSTTEAPNLYDLPVQLV